MEQKAGLEQTMVIFLSFIFSAFIYIYVYVTLITY